jgi:Tfp pilus assembly protein PilP
MKKIIVFATLLVLQVVIAGNFGCGDSQAEWNSELGRISEISPPVYNPAGKVDPFQPIFNNEPTKLAPTIHQTDCISNPVLEGMDMSQLKLTGIVLTGSRQIAIFQEANSKGHAITKGMCFGRHGGKVERILNDRVIVREEVQDATGQLQVKKVELKLNKDIN